MLLRKYLLQSWQNMWYLSDRRGNLSLRSMKRREGVFSPKAQKCMHRKEIYYINLHTNVDICFLNFAATIHKHYIFWHTII
jgi:hypothetical protein